MKYGVFIFATDLAMDPVSLAVAAEERGFESLFVPEHVHMPVERETRFPRSEDGSLPDEYRRIHDPFVALAAAAGATSEIRLGTGICLVTEHEPIALAKQIASLDMISGGRFEFGIGAGWLAEEMEPLGVRFADRWKVTEQRIAAMKEMWTQEEAEYHSEFVDIPKTYVIPKPTQNPHPPILIGAGSKWGATADCRLGRWLVAEHHGAGLRRARDPGHPVESVGGGPRLRRDLNQRLWCGRGCSGRVRAHGR